MSDKLRNPLFIFIFSGLVLFAAIFVVAFPFSLLIKIFLISIISVFVVGLLSYRWGLFLLVFLRPLLDFTARDTVITFSGLALNLPTIAGGVMIIFSLLVILSNRKNIQEKKITIAWVIFLLWSIISLLFSFDLGSTIKELAKFLNIFFAFLLGYVLIRNNKNLTILIKIIIFSSLLPALVALYQFINNTGLADAGRNRLFGTLTHPNMLAFYLLLPITLAIFIFLNIKKTKVAAYAYLGIAMFLIFILFFTYTRGAYLALIIIFCIVGFLKFRKFLLISILSLLIIYSFFSPVEDRVNSLLNAASDDSIGWRLDM